MDPLTVSLGNTTHEETCGGLTACDLEIGNPREGWRKAGLVVNCKACILVRSEAERYMTEAR